MYVQGVQVFHVVFTTEHCLSLYIFCKYYAVSIKNSVWLSQFYGSQMFSIEYKISIICNL